LLVGFLRVLERLPRVLVAGLVIALFMIGCGNTVGVGRQVMILGSFLIPIAWHRITSADWTAIRGPA
jgi:hypothetical protein